jgi:hypothetical protein
LCNVRSIMCIKPIGDKKKIKANSALFNFVFLRKAVGNLG